MAVVEYVLVAGGCGDVIGDGLGFWVLIVFVVMVSEGEGGGGVFLFG